MILDCHKQGIIAALREDVTLEAFIEPATGQSATQNEANALNAPNEKVLKLAGNSKLL